MRKKIKTVETTNEKEFIIVNELAEVFYGLKAGLPQFTNEWEKAKPLKNEDQFKSVQRGTFHKLEIMFL